MSRGVVAAGHPLTAEAGARVLREGGNAVDAAIAAVLASFVAESPLTGLRRRRASCSSTDPATGPPLLDFFVAAPAASAAVERWAELDPVTVDFGDTTQVFNVGAASCGVPGVPSGLAAAAERFGSMPLADLVVPGVGLARDGVEVNQQQAYLFELLEPILAREPAGAAALRARGPDAGSRRRRPVPRARRNARALRRRGPGPLLPRRHRRRDRREGRGRGRDRRRR